MPHAAHGEIEGFAALLLVVAGLIAVVVSARRVRASATPSWRDHLRVDGADSTPHQAIWVSVAAASLGASVIHLAVAPEHIVELGALGWGFVLAGVLQAAQALLAFRRPTVALASWIILLDAALLGVWVWSRALGLPIGPNAWQAEAAGRPDLVALVLEASILILLVAWLRGQGSQRAVAPSVLASFSIIPIVGIVALLTILALSSPEIQMHTASTMGSALVGW